MDFIEDHGVGLDVITLIPIGAIAYVCVSLYASMFVSVFPSVCVFFKCACLHFVAFCLFRLICQVLFVMSLNLNRYPSSFMYVCLYVCKFVTMYVCACASVRVYNDVIYPSLCNLIMINW